MNSQEGASLKVNVFFFLPLLFLRICVGAMQKTADAVDAHILNQELPKNPSVQRAILIPVFCRRLREEQDHNWLSDLVPYLGE